MHSPYNEHTLLFFLNALNMDQQATEQALYKEIAKDVDCMEDELCPLCSQMVETKVAKLLAQSQSERPPACGPATAETKGANDVAANQLDTFQFDFVSPWAVSLTARVGRCS